MGIPIPNTLVIWASLSHIVLAIWVRVRVRVRGDALITRVRVRVRGDALITRVRVRVRGDALITRVLGMGMPLSLGSWEWGCPYH